MMTFICVVMLATLTHSFYLQGNGILPHEFTTKIQNVSGKDTILKQGKLHVTMFKKEDGRREEALYSWLDDDIVTDSALEEEQDKPESEVGSVVLSGGCTLSQAEFHELEVFKKAAGYVERCYCEDGAVYCVLKNPMES